MAMLNKIQVSNVEMITDFLPIVKAYLKGSQVNIVQGAVDIISSHFGEH